MIFFCETTRRRGVLEFVKERGIPLAYGFEVEEKDCSLPDQLPCWIQNDNVLQNGFCFLDKETLDGFPSEDVSLISLSELKRIMQLFSL